jgi:hypothetical protein
VQERGIRADEGVAGRQEGRRLPPRRRKPRKIEDIFADRGGEFPGAPHEPNLEAVPGERIDKQIQVAPGPGLAAGTGLDLDSDAAQIRFRKRALDPFPLLTA